MPSATRRVIVPPVVAQFSHSACDARWIRRAVRETLGVSSCPRRSKHRSGALLRHRSNGSPKTLTNPLTARSRSRACPSGQAYHSACSRVGRSLNHSPKLCLMGRCVVRYMRSMSIAFARTGSVSACKCATTSSSPRRPHHQWRVAAAAYHPSTCAKVTGHPV
jgi:hypothetical protein